MRNPHFFKAYTRLGIHNLPYGSSSGVEKAADNILSDGFLDSINNTRF